MKILKKKKKKKNFFFFFFEIGKFFFKLGKKSPKSHWERGRISAPEDTKKNPWYYPFFGGKMGPQKIKF